VRVCAITGKPCHLARTHTVLHVARATCVACIRPTVCATNPTRTIIVQLIPQAQVVGGGLTNDKRNDYKWFHGASCETCRT
jgi:hypothetical protein